MQTIEGWKFPANIDNKIIPTFYIEQIQIARLLYGENCAVESGSLIEKSKLQISSVSHIFVCAV